MTALIQNFSVPANDDVAVTLQVDPALGLETLDGCTIRWCAYEQTFGIPISVSSPSALIEKSTGSGITVLPSPELMCVIEIQRADTVNLLRNYYHETTSTNGEGNVSTLNCGIMTVTDTRNRP